MASVEGTTTRDRDAGSAACNVVIVPGNGCSPIRESNWYGWLADELEAAGVDVRIEDMPDPFKAREFLWLPFIREKLGCDSNSIVVGHSSGAVAGMRLAETDALRGLVLVSVYHTDLGEPGEAVSGYFHRPWDFAAMRKNVAGSIDVLGSREDPFLPISEQSHVSSSLGVSLRLYPGAGHFMAEEFEELRDLVLARVRGDEPAEPLAAIAPVASDAGLPDGKEAASEDESDAT